MWKNPPPKNNGVIIKVHAASVNAYDWHFLTADIFLIRLMGGGLLKPQNTRLGADIAGRVEAVGKNVKQFRLGDEVFGEISHDGFAEYVCAPESRLALKPANHRLRKPRLYQWLLSLACRVCAMKDKFIQGKRV